MDYPDIDALPQHLRDAVTSRGSVNIYRMIMHSPGLAPAFFAMADAMFQANSLPPDWRELAIIRVGHSYEAPYEVHHHENLGRVVGLSGDAIRAAATGCTDGLPSELTAILTYTDLLLANHTLSEPERDDALRLLTVNQLADLVITVGFYQLVCNFLNTFAVTTHGEPSYGDPS